jgi:transcriptional regulator with XRE-family HTH domain
MNEIIEINGSLLRAKRKQVKMTQDQIAQRLSMTAGGFSHRETGQTPFAPWEIVAIAKILKLSIKDINDIWFGGKLPL